MPDDAPQNDLEWEGIDLARFIYECQRISRAPAVIRQRIERYGVAVVPADQYCPIPLLAELPTTFEGVGDDALPVYDRVFDHDRIRGHIARMTEYAAEFDPPLNGDADNCTGFFWNNPMFSYGDAMAYYCTIRLRKPARIVEIGSGFSTLVAAAAVERNGFGEIICIEPHPRPFLRRIDRVTRIIEKQVQQISVGHFCDFLGSDSILFIDSTHMVKIGSDCNYIYLVLIPSITQPMLIHTHDIMLPYGMNSELARDLQVFFNEQYLLYAYLMDNPRARVLFGSYYAGRLLQDEFAAMMAGKYPIGGGSLWYEINAPDAA
jgi:hypothetical protein